MGGQPAVNARDRIGRGPWKNAKGVVVAKDLNDLHDNPNINAQTAPTERVRRSTAAARSPTTMTS
jgi:hypothetical protein